MTVKEIIKTYIINHCKFYICTLPFSKHIVSENDENKLFSYSVYNVIRSTCTRCGTSLILTKEQDSKDEYMVKEEYE